VDSGFYAACAGLRAQSQALEVAAHNLANLNTTGFRGQQTTFQRLLAASRSAVPNVLNAATNNFGVLEGTRLDFNSGSLQATGNLLDVGIEGNGFFVVQTAQGTRYTRDGSFRVARTGELTTANGDAVLGDGGPIRIPSGTISISSDGTISVNSAVAGKIRLVRFRSRHARDVRRQRDAEGIRGKHAPGAGHFASSGRARILQRKCHQRGHVADWRATRVRNDVAGVVLVSH
jgi:flagellar basal-body rod protein FlgF